MLLAIRSRTIENDSFVRQEVRNHFENYTEDLDRFEDAATDQVYMPYLLNWMFSNVKLAKRNGQNLNENMNTLSGISPGIPVLMIR